MFRERRARQKRIEQARTERVPLTVQDVPEEMSVRAEVIRELSASVLPALLRHGSVSLTLGTPRERQIAKGAPPRPLGLVHDSGRAGESRRLDRVVSLRFDVPTHAAVSELAEAEGVTASEWIRHAVASTVLERQKPPEPTGLRTVGWSCEHMNLTSLPGVLGNVTAWCGCEMQPVYAAGDPA